MYKVVIMQLPGVGGVGGRALFGKPLLQLADCKRCLLWVGLIPQQKLESPTKVTN